jgi:hypothetical protein
MKKNLQSDEGTEHWSTKDGNQAAKATILNALDNTLEDLKMMELAPPPPSPMTQYLAMKKPSPRPC